MDPNVIIQDVASIATAIGVLLAALQLKLSADQARTRFEDDMSEQYREIIQALPVEAMLGEALDEVAYQKALPVFYRYIDLCNQQVFMRHKGRIRTDTWKDWCEGIEANLTQSPAFVRAWDDIKQRANGYFQELRWLEGHAFKKDPRGMKKLLLPPDTRPMPEIEPQQDHPPLPDDDNTDSRHHSHRSS